MPVYVYRNLNTGETFEIEQRISESALTEHPETGEPVKRLVQPVGIAFKGSGFYVTDSRKPAEGSSKASNGDAKADKGETKSETKADTKTETKAETKTEVKAEKKSESKGSSSN